MLLPLYLQTLMGYDATLAGWALAFGGIGSLLIMPVVGRLTTIIDSRILIFVGLVINAFAVYLMSLYNTQIDFATAWWPRFVPGLRPGATFVGLTTLTMARISQEKMGNATGIFNLMRNLGGSFGIAAATTLVPPQPVNTRATWWSISRPCPSPLSSGSSAWANSCRPGPQLAMVAGPPGPRGALPGGPAPGPDAGLLRRLLFLFTIVFLLLLPWSSTCGAAPASAGPSRT